ncbi:MAG: HypC/HybG/HupF family hydrogenase formation chaperone [Verrucomicrobiota bacterium]
MCLAVPGKILSVQGEDPMQRLGRVSFGGIVKEVNLACVPEAAVGDYVIVHVGLAISLVDEEEAQRTLAYFREMGELAEMDEAGGGASKAAKPKGTDVGEGAA